MAGLDSESTFEGLTWPDYVVIVLYFGFVLAVGLIVSDKGNHNTIQFENGFFSLFFFSVLVEKLARFP